MENENEMQNITPIEPKVVYSWTKRLLYIVVYRDFLPDGQTEVVAKIPRWTSDSEWIAKHCCQGLQWAELLDR